MWIGYRPAPPKNLEIVIQLDKSVEIGGLKIWNYNKSAIDCTKGIKDIQILTSIPNSEGKEEQTLIWSGTLDRGRGQINHEYATFIKILPSIELPKEVMQKQVVPPPQPTSNLKKIENLPELQSDNCKQSSEINAAEELKKYKSEAQIPIAKSV